MKKHIKKTTLTLILSFVLTFTAMLSGCSQSAQGASSALSQSSIAAPASESSGEDGSQIPPAGGAGVEDTAPPDPGSGADPDAQDDASAPGTSAPPDTAAAISAPPDAETSLPASSSEGQDTQPGSASLSETQLNVRFGDDGPSFTLHLYDNDTAAKIAEYVGTADWRLPIYHYDDYENWEVMQYYDIPSRYEIPSNPENVTGEKAGTVYYSDPNRIVLFYNDAEVPGEYTPVGYIEATQEFIEAVENNPVLEGWGNKIVNISK